MKKIYTLKPTEKQIGLIKFYWYILDCYEKIFYDNVYRLEKKMSKATGIKDIEFYQNDSGFVGVGTADRTMKLMQREELEKLWVSKYIKNLK